MKFRELQNGAYFIQGLVIMKSLFKSNKYEIKKSGFRWVPNSGADDKKL